jgi:hypothetical protein
MSTRRTSVRRSKTLWLSMPRLPRSTCDSQDSDRPTSPASTACDRPRRLLARAIRCPAVSRLAGVILHRPGPGARR